MIEQHIKELEDKIEVDKKALSELSMAIKINEAKVRKLRKGLEKLNTVINE